MGKKFRLTQEEYNDITKEIHSGTGFSFSPAIGRELLEVKALKEKYPWRR
jgi:hypothetical protein